MATYLNDLWIDLNESFNHTEVEKQDCPITALISAKDKIVTFFLPFFI